MNLRGWGPPLTNLLIKGSAAYVPSNHSFKVSKERILNLRPANNVDSTISHTMDPPSNLTDLAPQREGASTAQPANGTSAPLLTQN